MPSGSWDEYFGTRKWRVATEITGTDEGDPSSVRFTAGKFEIENGSFCSPLSSARGKAGVILQEVDPHGGPHPGADIPGSRIAVGVVVFRRARKEGAVR